MSVQIWEKQLYFLNLYKLSQSKRLRYEKSHEWDALHVFAYSLMMLIKCFVDALSEKLKVCDIRRVLGFDGMHWCWGKPSRWSRIVMAVLLVSMNLALDVIGPWMEPWDFATHLLFIMQANLMLYATFYGLMKVFIAREKISKAVCLYFVLALPAWMAGMHFFTQRLVLLKVDHGLIQLFDATNRWFDSTV